MLLDRLNEMHFVRYFLHLLRTVVIFVKKLRTARGVYVRDEDRTTANLRHTCIVMYQVSLLC